MEEENQFLDQLSSFPNDRSFRLEYAQWLQSKGHRTRAEYMRHRAEMMLLPVNSHRYCDHAIAAAKLEKSLDDVWLNIVRDDDLSVYELEHLECNPCWTGALPAPSDDIVTVPVTESISAYFLLAAIGGRKEQRPFYMRPDDERIVTKSRLARWNMPVERVATTAIWIHPDNFSFQASNKEADRTHLYQMHTPSDPGWWIHAFFTRREDWEDIVDEDGENLELAGQPLLMVLNGHWALLTSEDDATGHAQMAETAAKILDGAQPLTLRPLRLQPPGAVPQWQYLPDEDNLAAETWQRLFGAEPPRFAPPRFKGPCEVLDDPEEGKAARSVISHYLPRRRVETLHLRGSDISSDLAAIGSFPHLIDLQLTDAEIPPAFWQTLATCRLPNLTSFSLTRRSFDSASLEVLLCFPSLRRICLERSSLDDRGLSILSSLPRLEELDAQRTNVTDAGVEHLKNTELKYLSLRGCKVTDAALTTLGGLQHLEYLSLKETSVTNDGIPQLQRLGRLSALGLAKTQIDDDVVFSLSCIKSLKRVSGLSSQAILFLMDEFAEFNAPNHIPDRFQ